LTESSLDVLRRIELQSTDKAEIDRLNRYFNGEEMPKQIGVSLPPELRSLRLVLNYSRSVVNAYDERLELEGFRVGGAVHAEQRFQDWWQKNNLDEESSLGHVEALVAKRAFIVVGDNPEDPETPIFTVEPSNAIKIERDPRTQEVTYGLRLYSSYGSNQPDRATLYERDATRFFRKGQGGWKPDPEFDDDEHGMGHVSFACLVNRARLSERDGRSEIQDVLEIQDAACRTMTNLQAAQELLAVPQRYALGVTESDFQDQNGDTVGAWEAYIGRIFALKNSEAKVGEFSAAQLETFTSTAMFYARQVTAVSGVPLRYLGIAGDVNGSSGDSIREDDTKLNKRAERMQRNFSGGWEEAMRIGARRIDGKWDPKLAKLEAIWRDPSTPTRGSMADAAVKLYTATNEIEGPLLPREAVWMELGYSEQKRRWLETLFKDDDLSKAIAALGAQNGSGNVQPGGTDGSPGTSTSSAPNSDSA
jgi:hypothetical protein